MALNYLRRVQAINRNQGQSDVERGIASGEAIGKLLGGLGTAIKGAQKDALANKLMTDQAIASQPGAGQTQDLGTLPGGPQPGGPQPGPPANAPDPDPDPDPIQQPPQTFSNPSTGNIEPLQGQAPQFTTQDMPDLSQAVAQQKTASSLSAQPLASGDFTLNPSDYSGGGKTVGGLIHTGGVQELDLQKEMLAMQGTRQAQALTAQKGQMDLADRQAEASGTGRYALDTALKRAQLLAAQTKATAQPKTAVDKTSLATNMDTEPVADQAQLVRTYESTHGKGSFDDTVSALNAPDTAPDPNNPGKTLPNTVVNGNSVTLGATSKNPVTLQLSEAQTLAKQLNTRRITQGLPPIPVPGTDASLGSSRANPIPVQTRLDGASIPRGRWIRTPKGEIIQRP